MRGSLGTSMAPGLRLPTLSAPGPLGNSVHTPAKAQHFDIITMDTMPTLTSYCPHLCYFSLPVPMLAISVTPTMTVVGTGWEGLKQRNSGLT